MDLEYLLSEERREGRFEERTEIAKEMLLEGDLVERVVRLTKLSESEVLEIQRNLAL